MNSKASKDVRTASELIQLLSQHATRTKTQPLVSSPKEFIYMGQCCKPEKDAAFETRRLIAITTHFLVLTKPKSSPLKLSRIIPLIDITDTRQARPHLEVKYSSKNKGVHVSSRLVLATTQQYWSFPETLKLIIHDSILRYTQGLTLFVEPRDIHQFISFKEKVMEEWDTGFTNQTRWEERRRRFTSTSTSLLSMTRLSKANLSLKETFWVCCDDLYKVIIDSLEDALAGILSYIKQHSIHPQQQQRPFPADDPFHHRVETLKVTPWISEKLYLKPMPHFPPYRPSSIPVQDVLDAIQYATLCINFLDVVFQHSQFIAKTRDSIVFRSKSPYGFVDVFKIVIAGMNLSFAEKSHSLDSQDYIYMRPACSIVEQTLARMRLACISLCSQLLQASTSYKIQLLSEKRNNPYANTGAFDLGLYLTTESVSTLNGLINQCIQFLIEFQQCFGQNCTIDADTNQVHWSHLKPTPSTMTIALQACFILNIFLEIPFPVVPKKGLPWGKAKLDSIYNEEVRYLLQQLIANDKHAESESSQKTASVSNVTRKTLFSHSSLKSVTCMSSEDSILIPTKQYPYGPAMREIQLSVQKLVKNMSIPFH